jgi:hypothetical protein
MHLTPDLIREIAALKGKARRDYQAMSEYLGIGQPGGWITGKDLQKIGNSQDDLRGAEASRLRTIVVALPEPALVELTALMLFGRGYNGDFDQCLGLAMRNSRGAGEVDYVLGKPLDEYLPRALEKLGL